MRYLTSIVITITLLFIGYGCTSVPKFILFNNSSSSIGMLWNDKVIWIKRYTAHKTPNRPVIDSENREFSLILILNGDRYGYRYDLQNLHKIDRFNNRDNKWHLIVNQDGKIYLADPKTENQIPLHSQPDGFPIVPIKVK